MNHEVALQIVQDQFGDAAMDVARALLNPDGMTLPGKIYY
jgi:hypothetical protein